MSPQSGASQVEFLVVLLIFSLAMAISWPHLMLSDMTGAEAKAIGTLKQIHAAQADHFAGRRMYGTEQQLKAFGALDAAILRPPDRPTTTVLEPPLTYSIEISVSGARTKWCAAAIPSSNLGRTIAVDETGTIHRDRTCYGGVVQ
ncbi:MAG: hypothetical protein PSX80_14395 [bacterium]|nr:hypothetical protein [bacterium]